MQVTSGPARRALGATRTAAAATARDLVFAWRQARRAPVFAAGIVLSLGLGIGASATVHSWLQAMLLDPLPAVRESDRLISVRPDERSGFGISLDEFTEWRDRARTVSGLTAVSLGLFAIAPDSGGGTDAHPIYGMFAAANYFDVLGVVPARGRMFLPRDDVPGTEVVGVISDAAWRTLFGASPAVLGRIVHVNSHPVRIVGIAPPGFSGNLALAKFDLWVPLQARPALMPSAAADWRRRTYRWLDVIGRLRTGASVGAADAEFRAIARWQAATFAEDADRGARAMPLDIGSASLAAPLVVAVTVVTGILMLLICSNVANLMLTRAAARYREMATRLSLGSSRRRLILQLMNEAAMLAACGAVLGAALALSGDRALTGLMPANPIITGIRTELNGPFLAFVITVTAACTAAFGLAPAIIATRVDVMDALKNGVRGTAARAGRTRAALVVTQFALALSALVGATIFLRRDRDVHAMDFGFRDGAHVLLAQTEMSLAGYAEPERWRRAFESVEVRVRGLPGVRRVAVGSFVPLGLVGYWREPVAVPGRAPDAATVDRVMTNAVTADYFDLMGVPILDGRGIAARDAPGRPRVAVVNEAFAARYFPGPAAVGRTFTLAGTLHTIVGIARNGRYDYRDIDNGAMPLVYTAWEQAPTALVTLHVRTDGDPLAVAPAVRAAFHDVDPHIPLLTPTTLQDYASVPFYPSRSTFVALAVLATASLVLASIGLFSVISYGVTLRRRELGIRSALGASRASIVRMVLADAVGVAIAGTAIGALAAGGLVALLRARLPMLPGAAPSDYARMALLLSVCALAAGLLPAGRAARTDPMRTLRDE